MKKLKRFEILTALTTFISALILAWIGIKHYIKLAESDHVSIWGPIGVTHTRLVEVLIWDLIFLLPTFLILVGSVLHAFKQSVLSFAVVVVSGVLLTLYSFVVFFGALYYYGFLIGFVVVALGISAAATVFFASLQRNSSLASKNRFMLP